MKYKAKSNDKPAPPAHKRGSREHNEMLREQFNKRFDAQKRSRKP